MLRHQAALPDWSYNNEPAGLGLVHRLLKPETMNVQITVLYAFSGLLASYIDMHATPALHFATYTLKCQAFANVQYNALSEHV